MPTMRLPQSELFAPFRRPAFLWIWLTNNFSNFGLQIQAVAAAWLMTLLTPSLHLVALVATATSLPVLLFSVPFGAVADVFDRKSVLVLAQGVMFVAATMLAALAWANALTPVLLLSLTFALGCGYALNSPAWQAAVGELVASDEVPRAVVINSMGQNLARTMAPALGGVLLGAGGASLVFAINAATFIPLLIALTLWRGARDSEGLAKVPRETVTQAINSGWRYITNVTGVRRMLLRVALFAFGYSALGAFLPLVVRNHLQEGASVYGALLSAMGCGAVCGAVLSGVTAARLSVELILRGGHFFMAMSLLLLAWSPNVWTAGLAMFVGGLSSVMVMTTFNVTLQTSVPRWIAGRAMAFLQMNAFGGMALGGVVWGAASEAAGLVATLGAAGVLMMLVIGLGFVLPVRRADPDFLVAAAKPSRALSPAADRHNEPVGMMMEFEIAREEVPKFLDLMRVRRRIRMRQGVRSWSLFRDSDDPSKWVEYCLLWNWAQLLRLQNRRTIEDERNRDAIMSLHRGAEAPRLRMLSEWSLAGSSARRAKDPEVVQGAPGDGALPAVKNGDAADASKT